MQSHIIGVLLALFSAVTWSASDFSGGIATRRFNPFQVLSLSAGVSILALVVVALVAKEPFPSTHSLWLGGLSGIFGVVGLAALYSGLSQGNAVLVAPVAGVVGAAIPVLLGIFRQGLPNQMQLIGFILAFIGIWKVTSSSESVDGSASNSLKLALFAGLCFGGFLALIALVDPDQVFGPLAVAKGSSLLVALLVLWRRKQPVPHLTEVPIALFSGLLDAAGNSLFLLATQFTRLDIAAILSNLYPAGTVLFARMILGERLSRGQGFGVVICLAAIAFITI